MSDKIRLRKQREKTVINNISKKQEKDLDIAIANVCKQLKIKFPSIILEIEKSWFLKSIVSELQKDFPELDFHYYFDSSSMRPDGGILNIVSNNGMKYPILIAEKKNQGTNDLRATEGKGKQAKGNAIERLGKNVIGFRAAMLRESIFPFVCFGDGCDFDGDSSILDRVVTIAMFGHLNKEYLHNTANFNRGTFYFRVEQWNSEEMYEKCYSIAEKAIFYYFSKYEEKNFTK